MYCRMASLEYSLAPDVHTIKYHVLNILPTGVDCLPPFLPLSLRPCPRVPADITSRRGIRSTPFQKVVTLLKEPNARLLPDCLRKKSSELPLAPRPFNDLYAGGSPDSRNPGERPNQRGALQDAPGCGYSNDADDDGDSNGDGDEANHVIRAGISELTPRKGGNHPCVSRSDPLRASGTGGRSGVIAAAADGEGVTDDDRAVRESTTRQVGARGGEGGDLREVRRSALVRRMCYT